MTQYEGLAIPFSGDSDAKTSGNAAWLATLRRAALGRNTQTLPQPNPETGIPLLSTGVAIPACSLIGAISPPVPGAATMEPEPYLQATLTRSLYTFYTKIDYPSTVSIIEAFPFESGKPVRVRVNPAAAYYQVGMPVGRMPTYNFLSADGGGLILLSLPYTPNGGADYYAWVMLDQENLWPVRYKELLYAAVQSERDPSTALAYLDMVNSTGDYATNTSIEKPVVNRLKHISIEPLTYGEIRWRHGEWAPVIADCPGSDSGSGSII